MSEPERTDDGRWIVVDGRRWRASDPSIPEPLRQELVNELMAARRAVGAARRASETDREAEARRRVQNAKVALGERGSPWWDDQDEDARRERVRAGILALTCGRGMDSTICPSDAARAVGGEGWRDLMDLARGEVRALAQDGAVVVLQGGEVQDPTAEWRGPLRVRVAT